MTKIQGGEFIERERQLPPEDTAGNVAQGSTAAKTAALTSARLGAPPDCYDVRSVFDVRPVNGFDFNIEVSEVFEQGIETASTVRLEFIVPDGFVCVLRSVDIWFEPNPENAENRSDVYFALTRDRGTYAYNAHMSIGVASDTFPVYMLADEYMKVGVFITVPSVEVEASLEAFCLFKGTFLEKQGRPYQFEIANPVRDGNCAPEPPPPPRIVEAKIEKPKAAPVARQAPRAAPPPDAGPPPFQIKLWKPFSSKGGHSVAPKIAVSDDGRNARAPSATELVLYKRYFDAFRQAHPGAQIMG